MADKFTIYRRRVARREYADYIDRVSILGCITIHPQSKATNGEIVEWEWDKIITRVSDLFNADNVFYKKAK